MRTPSLVLLLALGALGLGADGCPTGTGTTTSGL